MTSYPTPINPQGPTPYLGSRLLTILMKELREIFRDRRTMMSVVVGPLLITPLLFSFMGKMIRGQVEAAKTKQYVVGVLDSPSASIVTAQLAQNPNFKLKNIQSKDDAEALIKKRSVSAVVMLPGDTPHQLSGGEATIAVKVLEDEGDQDSQAATGMIEAAFSQWGQTELKNRLEARGLPAGFARPFDVKTQSIPGGAGSGGIFLAMMLPYILSLSALTGGIYAAFDQVAGEKERGTLETLLVSPASRRDIVLGKFGAVVAVCLLSSVLSVTGLIISAKTGGFTSAMAAQGASTQVNPSAFGVILLVMVPQAVLFAGILLGVSTFARNQKEAQTYISPLMMVILLPILASIFLGPNAPASTAMVPVLGSAVIIKQALNGAYSGSYIALAFGSSVLYAGLMLWAATQLFQKESVLIKA